MKIDIKDVENLQVDGVDSRDYPDFCDAYFSSAQWKSNGKELTDDELQYISENYPELLNEMAYESLM